MPKTWTPRNGALRREWSYLRFQPKMLVVRCPSCLVQAKFENLRRVLNSSIIFSHTGVDRLFDSLLGAIIKRKDSIEEENELKKRDSVFLTPLAPPVWAAQADEEEAKEAQKARSTSFSCCSV